MSLRGTMQKDLAKLIVQRIGESTMGIVLTTSTTSYTTTNRLSADVNNLSIYALCLESVSYL